MKKTLRGGEGIEPLSDAPPARLMTAYELAKMGLESDWVKGHMEELLKRGFIIREEPTGTRGLKRITVSDPLNGGQVIFFEDEEALRGKNKDSRIN